jgi:hypothetical protein
LSLDFAADGTVTISPGLVILRGRFATPDEQHVRFEGDGLIGSVLGTREYEARTERDRLYLKIGAVETEYVRE